MRRVTNASHWGTFVVTTHNGEIVSVEPHPADRDPSPLLGNIQGAVTHRSRVDAPYVRRDWLASGPSPSGDRGSDEYVRVSWDRALTLVASELERVRSIYGSSSVFGGSYGWGSAGRFHHAQSQIHRFLNVTGGYVSSRNSYSLGAAQVLLPRVATGIDEVVRGATAWPIVASHTNLFVAFGGMAEKNTYVAAGGVGRHLANEYLDQSAARGAEFVLISPIRDDIPERLGAEWLPIRPGTDVAVMLGLAYVLIAENLHDIAFLESHCIGFERLREYIMGHEDGTPKTPEWAMEISGVSASAIQALARRMATSRTMVNISWSLQRARFGEQPLWMGISLAAMLGQIGLPGGGFAHGYGASAEMGRTELGFGLPTFPQGENPIREFIPVARIADMLLWPGRRYQYDGMSLTYPNIRLVYWAGGNPFHHHQDLFRLRRAFARPETIIVNEQFWTSTARHADIVLPVTTSLERNDFGAGRNDPLFFAMKKAIPPLGESRSDFEIFSELSQRLGVWESFTENRDEMQWLKHLYEGWRARASLVDLPEFDEFWDAGELELPALMAPQVLLSDFRQSPTKYPLSTPSGRIELYSAAIANFGYADCPGHPTWLEPESGSDPGASEYPLTLIANNPKTRLHSQLDVGEYSRSRKVEGREPMRMHPIDAWARGLSAGDLAVVYNEKGGCLVGVELSQEVRTGVVQLSTGAWFDPQFVDGWGEICVHGNPNVLTADVCTSQLSQATSGQHAMVQVAPFTEQPPLIRVDRPPIAAS